MKLGMLLQGQYHFLHFTSVVILMTFLHPTCGAAQGNCLKLENFLQKMFESEIIIRCSVQVFIFQDENLTKHYNMDRWFGSLKLFTGSIHTSGIVISEITIGSLAEGKRYQQPEKVFHAKRCSVVIVVTSVHRLSSTTEQTITTALTSPLLNPPTIRNRDKYLILAEKHIEFDLQKSKFLRELKYKLVLIPMDATKNFISRSTQFHACIKQLCQYGLCEQQSPSLIKVDDLSLQSEEKLSSLVIPSLFPDHERNFFGHTLRLSTTTKVPQLLELEVLTDANGDTVNKPKRGLYASVLLELSKRLNFTYTIIPSSGNGSTGHALPNGTWVGIVGDTFHGVVDFGFMAATTYQRFPYAEFCAPINFAYIGFVTGPPSKSYKWNAILWPFNPIMWLGVGLTILIASKFVLMISYPPLPHADISLSSIRKKLRWSYLKGISFLIRGLLEQCPDIPETMNHDSFRIYLAFWLLFCLVCTTVYRSKMVSLLTFPVYDSIPASFDELAFSKDFDIDFHYFGNVGYTYFKTSTNPSFVKIYKRMGREPNPLECLERTLRRKVACIIFIITFQELLHRNLSDQYGESPLKFTPHPGVMFPAGVIHAYKAPLSSNFQSVLFPAMETGLIPFWQEEDLKEVLKNKNHWQAANNIDINSAIWGHDVIDDLLRMKNLHGAFFVLTFGITIAILSFVVEKSKKRCGRFLMTTITFFIQ